MKIVYHVTGILLLLYLLPGCSKMPELPATWSPKIVLLGECTAGDSIYFRAAQSNPVIAGGSYNRKLIQGLDVQVIAPGGIPWNLDHEADDLSQQEFTMPYFSGKIIQASETYTVKAVHPEFGTASAMLTIPSPFEATILDTASETYHNLSCLRVSISLLDRPETGNAYAIEVVQQPYFMEPAFFYNGDWLRMSDHLDLYDSLIHAGLDPEQRLDTFYTRALNRVIFLSEDFFAEHVKSGNSASETPRSLFSDASAGNGSAITCRIYIPKKNIYPSDPGIYGYKTWVQVKSLAADYFHYLKSYEQTNKGISFDFSSNVVMIKGNVENGLGIIGGVFKRQFGFDL